MNLGHRGETLIKKIETLSLTSYKASEHDPWTIGWGHTTGVHEGMTITEAAAEILFRSDVADSEKAVNDLCINLTQSMFDATVSLCFNVGPRAISGRSTIGRALRRRQWIEAWQGFSLWVRTKNMELGQSRRRSLEMILFVADGWPE